MSAERYDDILKRAQNELSAEEQQKLVDELSQHAGRRNGDVRHSILDLEGLGKEIWREVDPDEFVAEERDSWDG